MVAVWYKWICAFIRLGQTTKKDMKIVEVKSKLQIATKSEIIKLHFVCTRTEWKGKQNRFLFDIIAI